MNINEILQNEDALVIVRSGDLKEFASVLANQFQARKNEEKSESKRPISQTEAMKLLNRSRQTMVKWRKKGILKGFLIGGRVYFEPEELAALQRRS